MTALACPSCRQSNAAHARFCETCGTPVSDNTTRYLCAAVHQNSDYCDAAIAEFLVEPVRALPPSPGADSGAVLRDAVAARMRRRVRDGVLLALLLVFAIANFALLALWWLAAIVVWVVREARRSGVEPIIGGVGGLVLAATRRDTARPSRRTAVVVGVGLVLVVLLINQIGPGLPYLLYSLGLWNGYSSTGPELPSIGLLLTLALFAVLATDGFLVHWLVHSCFQRGRFVADAHVLSMGLQQRLRTLGEGFHEQALRRIAAADRNGQLPDVADVIVHRDYSPFVGAGLIVDRQEVAISLVPDQDDDGPSETQPIDVLGLHERITADLWQIRGSSSLGPGGRLADLQMREQVLAPSEQLVTQFGETPQPEVLPNLADPPAAWMRLELARYLAQVPTEWARYYRCYRIETWDRDLTPSCFVHVGTDQTTLYLERVHCLLTPLAADVRAIDRPADPFAPVAAGLFELFLLPASVLRRARSVFGFTRPLAQRPGEVVPDRYGAARSLRELASSSQYRTYFQQADAARYQRILDRVLERAVGAYLEEHGYSAVEFQRTFNGIVNDYRNANFNNSAVGAGARTENSGGGDRSREHR
jgi:hypothetical protein